MVIRESNHPRDQVIEAGLACLILESTQFIDGFSFQLYQAVLWFQGVL